VLTVWCINSTECKEIVWVDCMSKMFSSSSFWPWRCIIIMQGSITLKKLPFALTQVQRSTFGQLHALYKPDTRRHFQLHNSRRRWLRAVSACSQSNEQQFVSATQFNHNIWMSFWTIGSLDTCLNACALLFLRYGYNLSECTPPSLSCVNMSAPTMKCDQGYYFDTSQFKSTVNSEVSWTSINWTFALLTRYIFLLFTEKTSGVKHEK